MNAVPGFLVNFIPDFNMLSILFILLHFILCCISYWLYKSHSLFTSLVFLSPFYFSFITFKFFELKKIAVIPGKYKAALISGSSFFLAVIITMPLLEQRHGFFAGAESSIIVPVLFSIVPLLIINKIPFVYSIGSLLLSFVICYYFILHKYFNVFLLLSGNSSIKGDDFVLSFFAAYFLSHVLYLLSFSLYASRLSSNLTK